MSPQALVTEHGAPGFGVCSDGFWPCCGVAFPSDVHILPFGTRVAFCVLLSAGNRKPDFWFYRGS